MLHDPCVRVPLIARLARRLRRRPAQRAPWSSSTTWRRPSFPQRAPRRGTLAAWMPDSKNLAADHSGACRRVSGISPSAPTAIRASTIRAATGTRPSTRDDGSAGQLEAARLPPGNAGKQERPVYKLFDLEADPTEERDLAGFRESTQETLALLKEDLIAWLLAAELRPGQPGRSGAAEKRPAHQERP
jgi:hypothetical protein